ncbi:MAG TPA: 7,8-didemethyl-8-hydroxy-5-deazariboflavin synthase CofG, partial [Bradyrhizobium sp.]|nr:7,8-didemethyl-8-hydroxy-5-deazariboflavin synthase CofG [Bradyrhizobium sp.]
MTAARRQARRFDTPLAELMAEAAALRDSAHGRLISYSRKVFIPLTNLCRDVCHYCTFAEVPRAGKSVYLSSDEVLAVARTGVAAGCTEALFTLGDKPELRYQAARDALKALGHETTISYLTAMCALVLRETGLLPHANPGVMTRNEIAGLREVTVSQGIMLESTSKRLCRQGGVHYGSPDKDPAARLDVLRLAGELKVPFTTGILIGIGETRDERIDALEAIRDLHAAHGHIQEVIVQNFRAKPDTKLSNSE